MNRAAAHLHRITPAGCVATDAAVATVARRPEPRRDSSRSSSERLLIAGRMPARATASPRPSRTRQHLALLLLSLTLLILSAPATPLRAQGYDPRTGGRTYVLAFPDTTQNTYDTRQDTDPRFAPREPRQDSIFIAIYSAAKNEVTITGNYGYFRTVSLAAGGFEVVFLNGAPRARAPIVTESGIASDKTFRLEATQPIVVYCFMVTKFGTEAWTPLPVESWGTEYYAAALPGEVVNDEIPAGESNYGRQPKAAPSEILVMAAFDDTRVTIVPNGQLNHNPPVSITLRKNQCYQVQSYVDTAFFNLGIPQADLGGSYIHADRPIGVISGNTRAQVLDESEGLAENSFKNMMIEWLTPTEQYGTEFVYLPTWDDRKPTGAPGENPDWMRQGEVVRVYGGSVNKDEPTTTHGKVIDGLGGDTVKEYSVERARFFEHMVGGSEPRPHVYRTDRPAQAFMNTTAVMKFNGTTGGGTFVGATFESWSTYMVQMVPREQWSWAAPYYAPIHPAKMSHYLNIVTDSNSRTRIRINGSPMVINRKIAGTDLWWGTKALSRGEMGLIEGADTAAKFYAFVYGTMKGFETFRPGRTKKDGDESSPAGNRDRRAGASEQVLHPADYEENIGFMYAYPLAASRTVLRPADDLLIDSIRNCGELTVRVRALNQNPVGLQSVTLDGADNAGLVFVKPTSPQSLSGLLEAEVKVSPIDPRKDASGIVVIRDRSGKEWHVSYSYSPDFVKVAPAAIVDFGQVTINTRQTRTITIANPTSYPLRIDTVILRHGTQAFTIVETRPVVSTDPASPTRLGPGDTLFVTIETHPAIQDEIYEDLLRVEFDCARVLLPLRAETVQPCLLVHDLDFGILAPGQEKSLKVLLCNHGRGEMTFREPWLTWLQTEFSVPAPELDKLKSARLGPDDCVDIMVTFKAGKAGTYEERAQFWSNTALGCRPMTIWHAVVSDRSHVDHADDAVAGYRLEKIEPNPASSIASIRFTLGEPGLTTVEIYGSDGRLAASLMSEFRSAGEQVAHWDPDGLPSGVYYCRIGSGAWSITRPILLVR